MQSALKAARAARISEMSKIDRGSRPSAPKKTVSKQYTLSAAMRKRQQQGAGGDRVAGETISPVFEGDTAVLFATGPSLTPEVVDVVLNSRARAQAPLRLFGCNDSYKALPALDVHYACDAAWWRLHYQELHDYPLAQGMWTQEPSIARAIYPKLRRIAGRSGAGLSAAQDLIHFGNNSGYQLINLALLFGIKTFILCGYNMSVINKRKHFFGDHPQGLNRSGSYTGFVGNYNTIKPASYGIQIINATPQSALTAFPKMSLEEAFKYAGL